MTTPPGTETGASQTGRQVPRTLSLGLTGAGALMAAAAFFFLVIIFVGFMFTDVPTDEDNLEGPSRTSRRNGTG